MKAPDASEALFSELPDNLPFLICDSSSCIVGISKEAEKNFANELYREIFVLLEGRDRLRYEMLFDREHCRFSSISFGLRSFHGYNYAYCRYMPFFKTGYAAVALFKRREDFAASSYVLETRFLQICQLLSGEAGFRAELEAVSEKAKECGDFSCLRPLMERLYSCNLLYCTYFLTHEQRDKQRGLFDLCEVTRRVVHDIAEHVNFLDFTIDMKTKSEPPMCSCFSLGDYIKLLMALLSAANDATLSRRATLSLDMSGDCIELILTTDTSKLATDIDCMYDICAIAPMLKGSSAALAAGDYIAGAAGCELYAFTDSKRNEMSFCLFIDEKHSELDFKSRDPFATYKNDLNDALMLCSLSSD